MTHPVDGHATNEVWDPAGLLVAVGVNCTAPQHILPLLGILRGQALPLLT